MPADPDRHRDSSSGTPRRRGEARKSFPLRLPHDLHEELRAWAEQEMRSLNSQIEYLLREAVRRRKGKS
ncbi:MAG: toxin-antitoxin system HicB family antitoxin [Planctomycetales bacterium]|nr:toxin-antitoxin system HicB family antitoxin [Planctomycetales bacterium]